jgi:hypothetical protein
MRAAALFPLFVFPPAKKEAQMVEVDEEDAGVTIRWLKYKAMWPTASRDFVVRTQV